MFGQLVLALILAATLLVNRPIFATAQDAAAGENVFRTNSSVCHSVQPGRNVVGPRLFGAVNRSAGHVLGFQYRVRK